VSRPGDQTPGALIRELGLDRAVRAGRVTVHQIAGALCVMDTVAWTRNLTALAAAADIDNAALAAQPAAEAAPTRRSEMSTVTAHDLRSGDPRWATATLTARQRRMIDQMGMTEEQFRANMQRGGARDSAPATSTGGTRGVRQVR
jgi:hypothetical protein